MQALFQLPGQDGVDRLMALYQALALESVGDDHDLYEELATDPLYQTTFRFMGESPCIDYFDTEPTNGTIMFRRYSSSSECVDGVIRKIIEAN